MVDKLDWLLSLPAGATHAANDKRRSFVEVTNGATGGKGVDLIVDAVRRSGAFRPQPGCISNG